MRRDGGRCYYGNQESDSKVVAYRGRRERQCMGGKEVGRGCARWRAGGRSEGGVTGLLLRTEKFTSIFHSARRKGEWKTKGAVF